MYLPTFWKITMEASAYKMRHVAGWSLPAFIFGKYSSDQQWYRSNKT